MKLYKVKSDFYPNRTGLERGVYLGHELPEMSIDMLERMLEVGVIEVVDEPMKAKLIDQKGFTSLQEFREFRRTIDIAIYGRVNMGNFTDKQLPDSKPKNRKITFVFREKTFGKNEFIFEQQDR